MGKELFKNIPSKVGDLVKDVRNGRIGLPDLQRPFVWRDNKVRELFDSMLKGYPIGYIMPTPSALYSEGERSRPEISSHNSFSRTKNHPSGSSKGISSLMFSTLSPTFS